MNYTPVIFIDKNKFTEIWTQHLFRYDNNT